MYGGLEEPHVPMYGSLPVWAASMYGAFPKTDYPMYGGLTQKRRQCTALCRKPTCNRVHVLVGKPGSEVLLQAALKL